MDGSANDFTFKHILNVLITATDETLGVEDGVARVHGSLVFGGITNQTLLGRERDIGGCGTVTLCVCIVRIAQK